MATTATEAQKLAQETKEAGNVEAEETGPTYKDKLDQLADEARHGRKTNNSTPPHPIVEKVVEYIPAAAGILGVKRDEPAEPKQAPPPGPPERPVHDVHIEEFVRDQHRSKTEEGLLEG